MIDQLRLQAGSHGRNLTRHSMLALSDPGNSHLSHRMHRVNMLILSAMYRRKHYMDSSIFFEQLTSVSQKALHKQLHPIQVAHVCITEYILQPISFILSSQLTSAPQKGFTSPRQLRSVHERPVVHQRRAVRPAHHCSTEQQTAGNLQLLRFSLSR